MGLKKRRNIWFPFLKCNNRVEILDIIPWRQTADSMIEKKIGFEPWGDENQNYVLRRSLVSMNPDLNYLHIAAYTLMTTNEGKESRVTRSSNGK